MRRIIGTHSTDLIYQNSLVKLFVRVKSHELREGSTVIQVKVAKAAMRGNSDFAVICPWL
jgi:hypothetical protein